jgi:hypothetical protein
MASPAIAVAAQVNGASTTIPSSSRSHSPMSIASSTKRKRDDTDDGSAQAHPRPPSTSADTRPAATLNGTPPKARDQRLLIRDYLDVLRKYAASVTLAFGILLRLPCSLVPSTVVSLAFITIC